MTETRIALPHNWAPRDYQWPLWDYLDKGGKRAVAVWHRRAGKDSLSLHRTTVAAVERVGIYWHMLPTLRQGRRVIWDGVVNGHPVLDAWPTELVEHRRNDEMKLGLKNGSLWQVVGSDNYNALVGANPVGVVFSEWSLTDPRAWEFVRPILAENGGWALFIYTPRGRNHGWDLYDVAKHEKDWFHQKLTVNDTKAISLDIVDADRRAGMPEPMVQQEYFCSFEAPLQGAYYADQMMEAEETGRIGAYPHDDAARVETWWDLGYTDRTAIWFAQRIGGSVKLIDYYENAGQPARHYVQEVDRRAQPRSRGGQGYFYERHVLPHDVRKTDPGSGMSYQEMLEDLDFDFEVAPEVRIDEGIEAVRRTLSRCYFDETKCRRGIDALRAYCAQPLPEDKWLRPNEPVFKHKPLHNWASHAADAFRYGILAGDPKESGWGEPLSYPDTGLYV